MTVGGATLFKKVASLNCSQYYSNADWSKKQIDNIRLHPIFHEENETDYLMLKVELIKEDFDENMKNKGSKEFQDMAERITTQVSALRIAS